MNKLDNIESGTSLISKIMELYQKYGFINILKAVASAIAIGYLVFFALNPTYIYDEWQKKQQEIHSIEITKRFEQTTAINNELENIKNRLGADRVFIIEFHNSVKSLNGYPFTFGSMNFETCADNVYYVSDEYTNFNLSKYKLVSHLYYNTTFFGSVEQIKEIDNRMYLKLLSNDVKELGLITIEGCTTPNGILGITYTNSSPHNWNEIKSTLKKEAVKLGVLFNK